MTAREAYALAYALLREETNLHILAEDTPSNTTAFRATQRAIADVNKRWGALYSTAWAHRVDDAIDAAKLSYRTRSVWRIYGPLTLNHKINHRVPYHFGALQGPFGQYRRSAVLNGVLA